MLIKNGLQFPRDPLFGSTEPEVKWSTSAPDTSEFFTRLPVASEVWRPVATGHVQKWVKVKNDLTANDWVCVAGLISESVVLADFTDGGGTSGTYDLANQLPAGAKVDTITVRDVTGFTGDTTATLIVGVTAVDTDQFNTGTPSVFTTADFIDMGPPSGDKELEAATTVTLLVTSGSDFAAVTAGALTINVPYRI